MAIFCTGLRPSLHLFYYILTLIHLIAFRQVLCAANSVFHISNLCIRERFHSLSKLIDGAVITSMREENLDCILTFHTETVLQRFMLRFENLALDCNDHLYIFDGDLAVGKYKADLSCRSTRADVGLIFTQGNFVTLKYVTDSWSKPEDGFQLVITAVKDIPSVGCGVLKCLNTLCISKDLACDGINHCGDNSDETSHAHCYVDSEKDLILGLQVKFFVATVLLVTIVCLLCVVTLTICLCKREQQLQLQQQRIAMHPTAPILVHPASYTGTTGSTLSPGNHRFATLPFEKIRDKVTVTTAPPPPYPGNIYTPAAGNNTTLNNSNSNLSNHHIIGNTTPVQQVVYYTTK